MDRRWRGTLAGRRRLLRMPFAGLALALLAGLLSTAVPVDDRVTGPAAYRDGPAAGSAHAAGGGDGAPLTGSDSDTTAVQGDDRGTTVAPGTGVGQPGGGPATGPGQSRPLGPPAPTLNPVELISHGPGGKPGSGPSGTPSLAGTDPGVVVFQSSDPGLTGDRDGRSHVLVSVAGKVERLTGDTPGTQFGGLTSGPSICASGAVVAYAATFQDAGDPVFRGRVVVLDRRSGAVERIPLAPGLAASPTEVVISADCRVVAWEQQGNVYGYDRTTKATTPVLVSADLNGAPAGDSSTPAVSNGGACVAFASRSPRIVPDDTNGSSDVFLRTGAFTPDPADDRVVRISRSFTGGQADGPSSRPSIAAEKCRVAYQSYATNIVPGDTNATSDVFLYDPDSDTNMAVTAGDGPSGEPWIAGDGDYVTFTSSATDLVGAGLGGGKATGATPTNFQVLDRTGRLTYGTSILAVDGPRVRVGFPASVDLAKATAGSVDAGALTDDQILPLDNADGRSNANPLATRAPAPPGTTPGDDLTEGPDLTSATVTRDDHGTPADTSDDTPAVRFCFDKPVAKVLGPGGAEGTSGVVTNRYLLSGYNSSVRIASERASLEAGAEPRCARADFPAGIDVSRFTLAAVLAGAVADGDGHLAVKASKPLTGTTVVPQAGDVTGPNLRTARTDLALNRVTYVFDEVGRASPAPEVATRFAFVDGQGLVHQGQAVAAVDASVGTVSIAFTTDRDNLALARRFVVLPDAVRSTAGESNVEQSTDGDVAGPELVAARRFGTSAPAQFDFTFNGPVTDAAVERFLLYTADGTRFPVAAVARPRADTVRVTAPAVDLFAATIVLGVAQPNAVQGNVAALDLGPGAKAANPLGTKPITRPPSAAGALSDGPDLVGVTVDPAASAVDFLFDENVRDPHLSPEFPELPSRQTDVFVRHFPTARTVQVSVDRLGKKVRGPSSAPSISFDGRFVVFASSASGLVASATSGRNVFRRDLLIPEVSPSSLDFGRLLVGAPSGNGAAVDVVNRGFGALEVATARLGGADPGHFRLTSDGCSGRTLQPEQRCTVTVAFLPTTDGVRQADLLVTDNALGSPRTIPLAGTAMSPYVPRLTVAPPIGAPGMAVAVEGDGFPPELAVQLRWARSPDRPTGPAPLTQVMSVTTDATGHLPRTFLLVFPHDVLGPRMAEVSGDRPDAAARVPFIVVPGTLQPSAGLVTFAQPDLVIRR